MRSSWWPLQCSACCLGGDFYGTSEITRTAATAAAGGPPVPAGPKRPAPPPRPPCPTRSSGRRAGAGAPPKTEILIAQLIDAVVLLRGTTPTPVTLDAME